MAVNYNILNKISEKYVDQQVDQKLGEMYYYLYYPTLNELYNYQIPLPKIIKGNTKEERYLNIIKNDKMVMDNFILWDKDGEVTRLGLPDYEFNRIKNSQLSNVKLRPNTIYKKLKSYISNIDEVIVEYMDSILETDNEHDRYLRIGKLSELEKIE